MDRRKYYPFIVIIVLFFIVKLSLLFLAIDKLIDFEECYRALIAKQLIDGPILPFFDLQCDSYSGGSLVVGLLQVPFFKLFGQNFISLKLVALSFSLVTLISLYLFCSKFFDRGVAIVTSLLFIFSPPFFTKYSLITMGFHTESILFSILLTFVFFEIFFNDKKYNSYFILLGLISGFGLWFTYIFSITLFTCLLFWFLLDRGFFLRKTFLIFLIAFTLGFSPWIYYNLSHSFSGLVIRGKIMVIPSFSTEHLIFSLTKLKNLLLNDIRNSLLFEDFIPFGGNYLSTFYYLIFIISFVVLFWLNKQSLYLLIRRVIPLKRFQISYMSIPKETFFLIYVVVFSLIYSLSNFKVDPREGFKGYRFLFPLYPFIFIFIALFISKIREGKMSGKIFVYSFLLGSLISIGLVSNLKLISFKSYKIDKRFLEIDYIPSYMYLGCRIGLMYGDKIDKCIDLINRVEERYRFPLYEGLGKVIGQRFGNRVNRCIRLINRVEEGYRFDLYEGLGRVIGCRFGNRVNRCIRLINRVEQRYRFPLYEGLGKVIGYRFGNRVDKCIRLINRVEQRYRFHLCRGWGSGIGSRFGYDVDKCIRLINRVKKRYRFHLYRGLGSGIGSRFGYDVDKCISLINRVEERYRPYVYKGLRENFMEDFKRSKYSMDKYTSLINRVEERDRPYVYKGFR